MPEMILISSMDEASPESFSDSTSLSSGVVLTLPTYIASEWRSSSEPSSMRFSSS